MSDLDWTIQLTEWHTSHKQFNRGWISPKGLAVYVRYTRHYINGVVVDTIDLANINATQQGKGVFTAFLKKVEEIAKCQSRVVYIENVLERRFQEFFERRGYVLIDDKFERSYFKTPTL